MDCPIEEKLIRDRLKLWRIEGIRPDRWDLIGVGLAIAGTLTMLLAPRG